MVLKSQIANFSNQHTQQHAKYINGRKVKFFSKLN